jgi:hypothetical protein
VAYHIKFKELGATAKRQLGVAALANGATITCELRLDLALSSSPECGILGRRVNSPHNSPGIVEVLYSKRFYAIKRAHSD